MYLYQVSVSVTRRPADSAGPDWKLNLPPHLLRQVNPPEKKRMTGRNGGCVSLAVRSSQTVEHNIQRSRTRSSYFPSSPASGRQVCSHVATDGNRLVRPAEGAQDVGLRRFQFE